MAQQEGSKTSQPTSTTNPTPTTTAHHQPPTNSDLMGSAKTVAEAAQSAATGQTDKIDKAKVAGAGEDLLEAGKTYGKVDEKGNVGQCIDKAEGYLHQMQDTSAATTTTATSTAAADSGGDAAEKEKETGRGGGSGGGFMKMAKGLFK